MLSDAEQRRLAEIEQAMRADDPSFARRISTAPQSTTVHWVGLGPVGWLMVAVTGLCLAMLLRSGVTAVVALSAACLSLGLWAAEDDRRRLRERRRSDG